MHVFWAGPQQSQDRGHESWMDRGWKPGGDAGEAERPAKDIVHWSEGECVGAFHPEAVTHLSAIPLALWVCNPAALAAPGNWF